MFAGRKLTLAMLVTFAEMVEWFKAHAWKACDVNASAGSNPVLCATDFKSFSFIKFTHV